MLERATACLKAGARDSLKCAQHAKAQAPPTGSRRRLHSTFWTHGAGDIESIDISLLSIGAGLDLPTRHDEIRLGKAAGSRQKKDLESATSSTHPEAPFLDFLYPPHALAWLQKGNGQPWERWERRNAKRLPEGFVQASRGYSSTSHARSHDAKSPDGGGVGAPVDNDASRLNAVEDIEPSEEEFSSDTVSRMRVEPTEGASTADVDPGQNQDLSSSSSTTPNSASIVRELTPSVETTDEGTEEVADEDEAFDTSSAISPGELPEQDTRAFEQVDNPHEVLRTMLGGKRRKHSAEDVSRAWFLYNSLSEQAKIDVRLMHELLLWFSRIDVETAQAHSISLFWSMPLEARTLTDYEAVLKAFLNRKTYDAVAGVHREALKNIPNGRQITKKLFQHAVHHNNWQLALAVKEDHDSAFEDSGPSEAPQKALFWIEVTEIPDLIQKAELLVHKCQWFQRRGHKLLDKFQAFSVRMSEEAFRQTLMAPSNWKASQRTEKDMTQSSLVTLLDSIRWWNPDAPRLFEEFLVKLLDLNQSEDQYRQVHNIVSFIYGHYREMSGIHPSEHLLEKLLSRVLPYAIYLRKLEFSKYSVSVEVIVEDWQKYHTVLSCWATKRLISWYARQGMAVPVEEYYTYLKRHYPAYRDQKSALSDLIYVHARRADSKKAQEAFDHVDSVAKLNATRPVLKCWNILMHALSRTDDIVGGLDTLRRLVDDAKLLPDDKTLHPLLEMLARRGDADGIADLLKQYDSLTGAPHTTSFVGSRMRALINSGDVPEAELALKEATKQIRTRELTGSLTGSFNIMIAAYAMRRDLDATMRTYRWMKAEDIRLDRYTYSALMLALIQFRQTPAAYAIMTKVMRKEGLEPTAAHYAVVLAGLVNQEMYDRAIFIHERMVRKNVRSSLATKRIYLQAVARKERRKGEARGPNGEPAPLMQVIEELRNALLQDDGSEIASRDPVFGHDHTAGGEDVLEHFVDVLFAHGKHRCFEAVHELFRMYQEEAAKLGKIDSSVPMRIVNAMMSTHLHSGEYDQVEAYWKIAKDNADRIAPITAIPDYERSKPSTSQSSAIEIASPEKENLLSATKSEVDRAEIGFEANRAAAIPNDQALLPASLPRMAPRPSPRRKYILTRPLRYHLRALAAQNRIADVLTTFTALVRQGYAFDSITWNRLIEYLCTSKPPLALLAFTLTERYLIPQFPGWTPRYMTRRPPRKSAIAEGLQFIRGRYMSYDALFPQYRTMVFLTSALLKLRRMEALGSSKKKGDIGRFMGSVRQIQAVAPKTLEAVNSMPQIEHDRLQHQLLRSDEANAL